MTAVPTDGPLFVAAAVIALVTLLVGAVTMATAGWYQFQRRRRSPIRDRMKTGLLERLFGPEPGWTEWVDGLSRAERRELRAVLEEYLRKLRGTEHDRLCSLARALGIQAEAKRNLDRRRHRFRALTWLALLQEEVDPDRLVECCAGSPRERAGAARVLHESGHPEAGRAGTELLIGDGERPLAVFGLDTLFRLNDGAETPMLSRFPAAIEEWDRYLLIQTLVALRYVSFDEPAGSLDWLVELLDHESSRVRSTTVGVIERHSWRAAFREQVDVGALVTDPEPAVRRNSYLMLAAWGDEEAAERLHECVNIAFDQQLVEVVRALWLHPGAELPERTERVGPVVDWVLADAAVTGRGNRIWGDSAAWA